MHISKVLLVDDDAFIRRVGELTLSRLTVWTVQVAASGEQALEMISKERPDVVLLDVMMPVLDGPKTLSRIRSIEGAENLPVIFMTAKAQRNEVQQFLSLDAAGVITKPFEPVDLPREIMNALRGWEQRLCKTA